MISELELTTKQSELPLMQWIGRTSLITEAVQVIKCMKA